MPESPDVPLPAPSAGAASERAESASGPARPVAAPSDHVAVVYFHGMGSQRHYEDLSRLVDRLDRAAYELGHRTDDEYRGLRIVEREARVERPHDPEEASRGRDVVYIRASAVDEDRKRPAVSVRFYEAYWAPETVDGTNAAAVAYWLMKQVKKPFQLLREPWRSYRRLRRGTLVALYQSARESADATAGPLRDRTARLMSIYEEFQAPGARSRYPKGTFQEFEQHITDSLRNSDDAPAATAALTALAREWRRDHDRREWLHLFGILTVYAGGLGLVGLVALLALRILMSLPNALPHAWHASLESLFAPTPAGVATLASLLLSALGIQKFLKDYVGDVQQYATYEETDKLYLRRRAVLDSATRQLRHVVEDEKCERVVVVAHSLGTAVAVDALLGLWRYNRASGADDPMKGPLPLHKVEHLITYGSPIDKINYFFSVVQSSSGTYEQLVEDLRGDIGKPPFSKVGLQPHMHWINYWDKGDIISGPIETVANKHLRRQEVDNVRVVNHVLPDLMGSHGGYIDKPSVLKDLIDVIVSRRHSFIRPPGDSAAGPPAERSRLGPGAGNAAQSAWFVFVFLLPWLLLGALIETLVAWGPYLRWGLAFPVAVHLAGIVSHRLARQGRALSYGLDTPAPTERGRAAAAPLP